MQNFTHKVVIIGVVVHILGAIFSVGYHHIDEHFQILEFAWFKLGFNHADDLSWEFFRQTRPAIQPAFVFLIIKLLQFFNIDSPFFYATILRLLSILLSFFCMYLLFRRFSCSLKEDFLKKWFVLLSFFLWFLPYTRVRFSSENWGGLIFWSGIAFAGCGKVTCAVSPRTHIKYLGVGMILGCSFLCRYQIGIMIAGFILWLFFVEKTKKSLLLTLCVGVLCIILTGIIIDYWFYGSWTVTAWHYFKVNLVEDKVSAYGISPWWYYLQEIMLKAIPPIGIVIVVTTFFVWIYYPKGMLTWIMVPFFFVHALIGHKALRFLFPLINILPYIIMLALQTVWEDVRFGILKKSLLHPLSRNTIFPTIWAINIFLLIISCLKPAYSSIDFYKYIYEKANHSNVLLLYNGENPYKMIDLTTNFYKEINMRMIRIQDTNDITSSIMDGSEKTLFVTRNIYLEAEENGGSVHCTQVYRNIPSWLMHFNFTNWIGRTKIWTVYECVSKALP